MSSEGPIGVFDSGVGGLSVLGHIRAELPDEHLIYLADTRYVPYGDKGEAFIRRRSAEIVAEFCDRGAKAIVVACNTATAAAVDHLRAGFRMPIIAMEPALKPAAALTRSDVIAVLATAGTLGSERYAALKDHHGRHVRVIERACHEWVELIEGGELSGAAVEAIVQADLEPLLRAGADVLVLGCTHFPFLEPVLRTLVDGRAEIIDPAPAVARQLVRRLRESGQCRNPSTGSSVATTECLYTGDEPPRIDHLPIAADCESFSAIGL
jgi:glutamate racemase